MVYQNLAEIYADIDAKYPDNDTRLITPATMRQVIHDIVEFFGRKTPFYDKIVHTGDANYAATVDSFIIICDANSVTRTVTLPSTPENGQRLILFVKPEPILGETPLYWQTNIPFFDGNTTRMQLGNGRQELLYDTVDARWILLGGL